MRNWIKVMAFAILAQGLPCFSPYRCDAADIVISTATTSLVTLNSTDKLTVTGPSAGSITVASGSAVNVNAGVDSIINNGAIKGTSTSSPYGWGIQIQNGSSIANGIFNYGTIEGYFNAIGVVTRGTNSGSTISGGITNSGTLQINYPANLGAGGDGSVITLSGVTLSGGINNSGSILHSGSANKAGGIWLDTGTIVNGSITNSGTINSVGNASILVGSVTGAGTVNDGIKNLATGLIDSGIIAIRMLQDGTVNGGIDNYGTMRGGSASINLGNNAVINGGITNGATGLIETTATNGTGIGVTATSKVDGTINNAGTIKGGSATGVGISVISTANILNGGITKSGTISGGSSALNLANSANAFTVTNTGTLSGAVALGINTLNLSGTTSRVTGATTGTNATVNVNGTFTSENTFNVGTFNVNNGGTFVMNNNVTAGAGNFNNAGTLQVDAAKSVTLTGTFNNSGTALINGSLANSTMNLSGGGAVKGSGTFSGSITGNGTVNPGNSAGILTAGSVNPTGGTGFNFEFTGFDPTYGTATASVNDVLRLTSGTPFVGLLNTANNVTNYFDQATINAGDVFKGGFFTDTASDFTSSISGATYNYYIKGDGNGTATTYGGQGYYLLSSWQPAALLTLGTTAVAAPFAGGTVNGFVMTLTATVPEPSTCILGAIAASAMAFLAKRRKKVATKS